MTFPESVSINVTATDIKKGLASCMWCPMARAARRRFRGCEVFVLGQVSVGDAYYNLPLKAKKFIDRFDLRKPVEPFRFTMTRSA